MNHEHSDSPRRHGEHSPFPIQKGDVGGQSGSPAQQNPQHPHVPENGFSDSPSDQQALPGLENPQFGQEGLALFAHQGPTPLPAIIKQHNDICPGAGDRIMDDAHEDMVLDRKITESSFRYSIFESKVRLGTAVCLISAALILIPIFLFLLDPPESIAGATLVGLAASTPLVATLLNSRDSKADRHSFPQEGQE